MRLVPNLFFPFFRHMIRLIKGRKGAVFFSIKVAERLLPTVDIPTKHGIIYFFCPSTTCASRAYSLLSKEPETISWIDGFATNDVLWDIGANIGVYTLYAAARGMNVLAFEPSPYNLFSLSKNIELNKFDQKVGAFCLAFHNTTCIDKLNIATTRIGKAANIFSQSVGVAGTVFEPCVSLAMVGYTIDDFIATFHPLFPNHIKIDVEGNEALIIQGAKKTIADPRVKSILVETDSGQDEGYQRIDADLKQSGFILRQRANPQGNKPELANIRNHIYTRGD